MPRTFDRQDLDFQLYDVAGFGDTLNDPDSAFDRSAIDGILNLAEQISAEHFEPIAAHLDEHEPEFVDGRAIIPDQARPAIDAFVEAGFLSGPFPEDLGGLGLPEVAHQAISFVLSTANISLAGFGLLTVGSGRLIGAFGTEEQKRRYLLPMVEGTFFGTMCLSEPQAGSSLSDITTRATPREDGTYAISGKKMWISGGEHDLRQNIVHMVLAKLPDAPAGVKGISLFIVPKVRVNEDGSLGEANDVSLAGLNHKMGYRGITNCALNFGENGECIGELVGEPHRGLQYMFQMMNEARIGVGLGATALAQAGYQASLDYARERPQGRSADNRDPSSDPIAIIEHADVRRLLLAQKVASEGALALCLYCASLVDQGTEEAETLLGVLTPIAKSWPSEFCLEANKHAIQVLGGAGYTRDYPVERLYRDNRLNAIHEGTHGIQGLDLLGRKVVGDGMAGLSVLAETIRKDIASAETGALQTLAEHLGHALDDFLSTADVLSANTQENPKAGLSDATLFLDAGGHIVIAWMWLRIAQAALERGDQGEETPFLQGKLDSALYFFERELPKVATWFGVLLSGPPVHAEFDPEGF